MTRTEALPTTENGEDLSSFPLLEKLIHFVTTENPEFLKDELFKRISKNPAIDSKGLEILQRAVAFMEEVHEGQPRKYNYKPAETQKPFITHTLSTALMVNELMGESITVDALVVALLHDVIEDGKITDDGGQRNVRKSDILERGFSQRIADAVEALSNVRDSKSPNGYVRRKLTDQEYVASIREGAHNDPFLGIEIIKVCDRSTNAIDPFLAVHPRPVEPGVIYHSPNAFTSRKKHISNTEAYLFPMVANNQKVTRYIHDVIDLAKLTCTADFNPKKWKKQLRDFQAGSRK